MELATTAIPASVAITRCSEAAGTGDVLMARLRDQANTVRGAGHFLRETVGRVRITPEPGDQLTVRADSGF